jgi:hypothetical protein
MTVGNSSRTDVRVAPKVDEVLDEGDAYAERAVPSRVVVGDRFADV